MMLPSPRAVLQGVGALSMAEHEAFLGSLFPTAQKMAQLLIRFLERELQPSCQVTCLESIRILSRDKYCLEPFTTKDGLRTLSRHAGIDYSEELIREVPDLDVILESLKCLCNIVFSSPRAQELAAEARLMVGLARRIKLYNERSLPHEVKFFDLRLLFLLTALRVDTRQQLAQQLRGVSLMADTLELTLGVKWMDPYEVATEEGLLPPLPRQETERAMEILKVLFNITFDSSKREVDEVSPGCPPIRVPVSSLGFTAALLLTCTSSVTNWPSCSPWYTERWQEPHVSASSLEHCLCPVH